MAGLFVAAILMYNGNGMKRAKATHQFTFGGYYEQYAKQGC
jgi:hypothetical protein